MKIANKIFGIRRAISLMRGKGNQKKRWTEIEKIFSSNDYSHFELVKGTLDGQKGMYGVTFKVLPKVPDDVRKGELKPYWITVPDFMVKGLLENCLNQAVKEKNQFSVNKLKIELQKFS